MARRALPIRAQVCVCVCSMCYLMFLIRGHFGYPLRSYASLILVKAPTAVCYILVEKAVYLCAISVFTTTDILSRPIRAYSVLHSHTTVDWIKRRRKKKCIYQEKSNTKVQKSDGYFRSHNCSCRDEPLSHLIDSNVIQYPFAHTYTQILHVRAAAATSAGTAWRTLVDLWQCKSRWKSKWCWRTIESICRFYLSRHSMKIDINIILPLIWWMGAAWIYSTGAHHQQRNTQPAETDSSPLTKVMKFDLACGAFCVISNRARTPQHLGLTSLIVSSATQSLHATLTAWHIMAKPFVRCCRVCDAFWSVGVCMCVRCWQSALMYEIGQYFLLRVATTFTLITVGQRISHKINKNKSKLRKSPRSARTHNTFVQCVTTLTPRGLCATSAAGVPTKGFKKKKEKKSETKCPHNYGIEQHSFCTQCRHVTDTRNTHPTRRTSQKKNKQVTVIASF